MLIPFRNMICFVISICFLDVSSANAQYSPGSSAVMSSAGQSEGLTLSVTRPIAVTPKSLRVVFPFKAEGANHDKAIEAISTHMKAIQAKLSELGASPNALEFAEVETNPSNANPYSVAQGQMGVQVNGFVNGFQAVQIAPAVPMNAVQAMPAMRLAPAQRIEPPKSLPTFVIATSAVCADWNVEGKSAIEIAAMKPKLLASIAEHHLDGKNLVHKFSPEQEDEIFEITKIDIRNGDTRSMFSGAVPPPRAFFVGFVTDADSVEVMRAAFQTAEKMTKEIARAGRLKIGKVDSVHIAISPRRSSSSGALPTATLYSYPSNSSNPSGSSLNDWEPTIPTGEIRMDSLNQLKQDMTLTVRYHIE